MAVESLHLTSGENSVDGTSFATASISPSSNKLVLAFFIWSQATPGTASASGNNLTWVEVATRVQGGMKCALFRALGTPSAGTVTFSVAGGTGTCTRSAWSVAEFNNVDLTGTNGSGAVVQSAVNSSASANSLTVTLAAFGSVDNASYGATGGTGTTAFAATEGSGFTELGQAANPTSDGMFAESEFKATNDTSVDWTYNETDAVAAIAVEIKYALAPTASGNFLAFMT